MESSDMRWKFLGLYNLLKKTVTRYDKSLDLKWHWPQGGAQNTDWYRRNLGDMIKTWAQIMLLAPEIYAYDYLWIKCLLAGDYVFFLSCQIELIN